MNFVPVKFAWFRMKSFKLVAIGTVDGETKSKVLKELR
jgi:hypothetical protein